MVQWNSWRCTGIPVLEGSPLSKRFMMGKIIVYIGISGAQFAPQFPQIGAVVISKRVLYMTFTSNHPWKGVGWLLFPSPLARQLLGSRGVAQLAPPGRWYAGNDVDELRGTLGGGGAAAAYWRGGLYINGCQCEWHASWWLGTSFVFFGHMEVFFFFFSGGIFLNGGLVKQQFWFFGVILGTLPDLFVAVFMLKHSRNAMAAEVTSILIPTLWLIWRCTVQNSLNDYTPEVELT